MIIYIYEISTRDGVAFICIFRGPDFSFSCSKPSTIRVSDGAKRLPREKNSQCLSCRIDVTSHSLLYAGFIVNRTSVITSCPSPTQGWQIQQMSPVALWLP